MNYMGIPAPELIGTVLIGIMLSIIVYNIGNSLLTIIAEINAQLALDPEERGLVSEREIEREACRRKRAYVVAIQKGPLFPFFLLLTLVSALFFPEYGRYVTLVKRAVRRYWAY